MVRRIKPLHQVTQTECGLVACVMLMKALGSPITLREAREKYEVGRDGLTIRQIRDLLTNQGLAPRVLKVPDSAIFDIPTPAIAYWKKITLRHGRKCRFFFYYSGSSRRT